MPFTKTKPKPKTNTKTKINAVRVSFWDHFICAPTAQHSAVHVLLSAAPQAEGGVTKDDERCEAIDPPILLKEFRGFTVAVIQ